MSFIRQIAVPVLLTVFGTVAFLGTGLHLIPGCDHFHVHSPWQHCADHLHAGHQHEKASHQHGFGTSHPSAGIYLLPLELASSDAMIQKSLPFFLLYNNGLDEEAHDAAIEWVRQNLIVPEASSLMLAVIGSLASCALRHRKRN